jgi:hypothetical protein
MHITLPPKLQTMIEANYKPHIHPVLRQLHLLMSFGNALFLNYTVDDSVVNRWSSSHANLQQT